MDPYGIQQGI